MVGFINIKLIKKDMKNATALNLKESKVRSDIASDFLTKLIYTRSRKKCTA